MKLILLAFLFAITSNENLLIQNANAEYSFIKYFKPNQKRLIKEYQINPNDIVKIKSGDKIDEIENGDIVTVDNSDEFYVAVRDSKYRLIFELLENDFEIDSSFKKPCVYQGKIYAHGQVIAVHPGKWLNYRGFPIMLSPGIMLVCNDGNLIEHEIRPRY